MGAADLLQRLRVEGFGLTVDGNCLIVTPATELTDDRRVQIRLHKPELLALLADWPDEAQREDDPERSCTNCRHRLKPGTCSQPIAAGLLTAAEGFGIVWPAQDYGATCAAFGLSKGLS